MSIRNFAKHLYPAVRCTLPQRPAAVPLPSGLCSAEELFSAFNDADLLLPTLKTLNL